MAEVLIASSVLIAALLLLRGVFRKSLSRRIQYALWGLVLLRLLIPFRLPQAGFSVLTSLQPVRAAVEARLETRQPAPAQPSASLPGGMQQQAHGQQPAAGASIHSFPAQTAQIPAPADSALPAPRPALTAAQVLSLVRWAGTALLALFFLWVNLGFWLRLRRARTPCPVEGHARRTYLVEEGLSSPCLFGLLRPAVYLTPAAVSSPQRLRHIMAHEETHARHLDPLWSLLRCVCLALYWFDPLVWIASAAARTDCELACDEGTLARLGDEARIPYGETLLSLVPVRRAPSPLLTATTMTTGKRQLKDRLSRIIHKPRRLAAATAAALALAAAVSACTFTTASRTDAQVLSPPAAPATGVPTKNWSRWFHFDGSSLTFVGQQQAMDLTVEEAAQRILLQTGLLPDDPSYWIQDLWDELTAQDVPLTLTLARGAGGDTYLAPADLQSRPAYSGISHDYRWRSVDGPSIPSLAEEDSLTIGYASRSLTFYDPSGLVRCERGGACRWFQAVPKFRGNGPDFPPFRAVRTWYDAVEIHMLRAAAVVPDDGRSREAIAQELMERYEGACLSATTGSIDRCTYIAIRDMKVNESVRDSSFPEEIRDKEPFRVIFQVVFVPESEQSLQWTLACDPHVYEGAGAPEGARWIHCTAALYLAPDGWRCHSVGG